MAAQEFTTEELANEIWKPVVGYEGWYSVSSLGRVRRDKPQRNTFPGRILRPVTRKGYYAQCLTKDGKHATFTNHSLVAAAFIGPRPPLLQVNHKDANKLNNRDWNLEYVTHLQNQRHAVDHGLTTAGNKHWVHKYPERISRGAKHSQARRQHAARGEQIPQAKLCAKSVREIRAMMDNEANWRPVADRYQISKSTVFKVWHRQLWKHVE